MRTVTIEYDTNDDGRETIHIEDSDGQWVDVEFLDTDYALILSELHGDAEPVTGSEHPADAEMQALYMMGIPNAR